MSPGSPSQNGDSHLVKSQASKIETIKNWSISTYKCTKQLMFEKLGKTSRTVDTGNSFSQIAVSYLFSVIV